MERCRAVNGPNLDVICAGCKRNESKQPGPWFQHIWFLMQLQDGGYPYEKDDLTVEEWLDLGEMRKALEQARSLTDKDE
jgi:hypothetical protein